MSDIEDTKQCSNCKLEIPASNYTIHFVHCQRNFYLCSKCEQPVNYTSRADHDGTNHALVNCTDCQLPLEKYLLEDHLLNNCPDRKVKCQICDIEVKATDIAEHENYCGSRTEKCPECGEFVMLKYKSLHIDSNHTFVKLTDEPGPSPSWQYGRRTLCNFLPDLSSKSCKVVPIRKRKSNEHFRRSRNSGTSGSTDDINEITDKNFDTTFEKEEQVVCKIENVLGVKEVKNSVKKDMDEWPALSSLKSLHISEDKWEGLSGAKANDSVQNEEDEESDFYYAIQVSQEINSDIWRKEASRKEETLKNSMKPFVDKELSAEKFMDKNLFEKTKKVNQEPKPDILKNNFNYLYNEHESVELPCEFCGNLIVSNCLLLHQRRCRLYLTETSEISRRNKTFLFDEDVEQKIACGVCNKFFSLSHLENHQLHCQKSPMKSFKNQEKMNYSKNLKTMKMRSEQGLQNGVEPSTPQVTRMSTGSEWLDLSINNEGERNVRNNLSHPESGVITRGTRVSRKSRRAPSPPRR